MQNGPFKNKTVFFSCADKTGVPELAEQLHQRGWLIFSAGGTCDAISKRGVPVSDIKTMPGSVGEMLGHRLLTLQPCAHGPLLADGSEGHAQQLALHGFPKSYDLVIIDFYPFEKVVAEYEQGKVTLAELWEKIDVGGPAMVKSAFKGKRFIVVDKSHRDRLIGWMDEGCPNLEIEHDDSMLAAIRCVANREKQHYDFFFDYLMKTRG